MDYYPILLLNLGCLTAVTAFRFSGPDRSDDILLQEGASFTFECWGQIREPPTGGYLQVLKRVVSFPRFSYPRADDTPNRFDDVTIATGTTLDSGLPAHVVDRYTVTRISRDHDQPSEGIAVHVRDAVSSDSGEWACRLGLKNSESDAVTTDYANITVITPVLDIQFFEARDVTYFDGYITYVANNVTLNAEEPKKFGCQVWINSGLPNITAYWQDGNDLEEINTTAWHIKRGEDWDFGITHDWRILANSSGQLWTRTHEIPDVGSKNGKTFTCEASLPFIGSRTKSITVFSSTPPGGTASSIVFHLGVAISFALVAASVNCD